MKYLHTLVILSVVWGIAFFHKLFHLNLDSWYSIPLVVTYVAVIIITTALVLDKVTK